MKIRSLEARPILDSRAAWTVEIDMTLRDGVHAVASVPEGKSKGSWEAWSLPASAAARKINKVIAPRITRHDFRNQAALDAFLIELDGTGNKSKLGADTILAVSIAFARACAAANHIPLWKHIRTMSGLAVHASREIVHPHLFINMINGGMHAGNNLHFQEYLVILFFAQVFLEESAQQVKEPIQVLGRHPFPDEGHDLFQIPAFWIHPQQLHGSPEPHALRQRDLCAGRQREPVRPARTGGSDVGDDEDGERPAQAEDGSEGSAKPQLDPRHRRPARRGPAARSPSTARGPGRPRGARAPRRRARRGASRWPDAR